MKKRDVIVFSLIILMVLNIFFISSTTITYGSRNGPGAASGCKGTSVVVDSNLDGVASIKVSNIKGSICPR